MSPMILLHGGDIGGGIILLYRVGVLLTFSIVLPLLVAHVYCANRTSAYVCYAAALVVVLPSAAFHASNPYSPEWALPTVGLAGLTVIAPALRAAIRDLRKRRDGRRVR